MKTMYDVLSKEEKKNIKKEFAKKNPDLAARINRILWFGLLLIIFSLAVSISSLITNDPYTITFLIIYGVCLVFGVFLIIKSITIKKLALNRMLKEKKNK